MRFQTQAGFTLIEVLIAAAIVAMGMGLILQLFSSAASRQQQAARYSQLILAEKQIYQHISGLDIVAVKRGKGELEGFKYQWQAQANGNAYPIMDEGFVIKTLQLYDVNVVLNSDAVTSRNLAWQQLISTWKD